MNVEEFSRFFKDFFGLSFGEHRVPRTLRYQQIHTKQTHTIIDAIPLPPPPWSLAPDKA
jgi:hypothetical protein